MTEKQTDFDFDMLAEQAQADFLELLAWSRSLTPKQLAFLCDAGCYNDTIRGYMILAARQSGLSSEQIKDLVSSFSDIRYKLFYRKMDADAEYQEFEVIYEINDD